MSYKLVVLDWNGTCFDDLKSLVYPSIVYIFKSFNKKPPSLATYQKEITAQFTDFYWSHGIPKDMTAERINELRRKFFEIHWNAGKLRKGVRRLLEWCGDRELITAIVSAEVKEVLEKRLKDLDISHLLDRVTGNAFDKESALVDTLDTFGIKAEEAVYVDDTYDGLTAAKNIGMNTIGFTDGYNTRTRILAAKPDFPDRKRFGRVDTMYDVRNIIRFVNNGGVK